MRPRRVAAPIADLYRVDGQWDDGDYIAALGHYQANLDRDWRNRFATHAVVLLRYGLASMSFQDHWIEDFMWYGPAGIGSARGLRRYQNNHSIPFLTAFPDRKGGYHYTRIGDGDCVATGGWGSVIATHAGDGWLGMPATGKRVEMRVMDFYRLERDGLIAENWVPIDVIDVLRQIGFDVFDRLRPLQGRAKETL